MDTLDTATAHAATPQEADESTTLSSATVHALGDLLGAMRAYQAAAAQRRALRIEISWIGPVDAASPRAPAPTLENAIVSASVTNGLGNGAQWTHNLGFLAPPTGSSAHALVAYQAAHRRLLDTARGLAAAWDAHPVLRPMACRNADGIADAGQGLGNFHLLFTVPVGANDPSLACQIGTLTVQSAQGLLRGDVLQNAVAQAAACPISTPRKLLLESVGAQGLHLSMIGVCYGQANAWKRLWSTLHHPKSGVVAWSDEGGADSVRSADPLDHVATNGPHGDGVQRAWDHAWNTAMALPAPAAGNSGAVLWTGTGTRVMGMQDLDHGGGHPTGSEVRAHRRAIPALGTALVARYPLLAEVARKGQLVFHFGDGGLHKMLGVHARANRMLWLSVCGLPLTLGELGRTLVEEGLETPHPEPAVRKLQSLWIDLLAAARTDPPSGQVVAMEHRVDTAHAKGQAPRFQWSKLGNGLRPDGTSWEPSPKLRRALQAFADALHAGWPTLRTQPGARPHALRVHPRGIRGSIAVQWETRGMCWPGMIPQIAPCHGVPSEGPWWMITHQSHWKRVFTFQAKDGEDARLVAGCLEMVERKHLWKQAF